MSPFAVSKGGSLVFAGHHFISKDEGNDTLKADTIENAFKELHSEVDAVFSYEDHLYMIKVNSHTRHVDPVIVSSPWLKHSLCSSVRTTKCFFTKLGSPTPTWTVTPSL